MNFCLLPFLFSFPLHPFRSRIPLAIDHSSPGNLQTITLTYSKEAIVEHFNDILLFWSGKRKPRGRKFGR
jgi:hypothetical protein